MNKLYQVFIGAVLVATATTGHVAGRQVDEASLEAIMERAEENRARLGLTPEQEDKVKPILVASRERRLAILEKYGFGRGQKPSLRLREKLKLGREMKAVRADTEAALAQHLTPEQIAIYKDIRNERWEHMK